MSKFRNGIESISEGKDIYSGQSLYVIHVASGKHYVAESFAELQGKGLNL